MIVGELCPICGTRFGGTIGTERHPDPAVREAERAVHAAWTLEIAAKHRAHNEIVSALRRLSGDDQIEATIGKYIPLRRRRARRR